MSCTRAPVDSLRDSQRSWLHKRACSLFTLMVNGATDASSTHSFSTTFHLSTSAFSPNKSTPFVFLTTVNPDVSRNSPNFDVGALPPPLPLLAPLDAAHAPSYKRATTSAGASTKQVARFFMKLSMAARAFSTFSLSPVTRIVAMASSSFPSSSLRARFTLIKVPVSASNFCTFFPLAPIMARALSLSTRMSGGGAEVCAGRSPPPAPPVRVGDSLPASSWTKFFCSCSWQAFTSFVGP
mmetsp:Transcript_29245/g.84014  ORF Transcript_29245/g.84014 Transcript_29245/m.84014 type:complete len:239 (-) Transcript_29245:1641-2357(-)